MSLIRVDEIPRVEWRNERVATTAQIAEFYECTPENIRDNFRKNREHFIDGKHFFKLEGDDLRNLRVKDFYLQISPMTRTLYLWTKRGAARHAKMLNTDRAWEVFEALEDNYFNRPAAVVDPLVQAISEVTAVECDKLALEREKFNVENSEETKHSYGRRLFQ